MRVCVMMMLQARGGAGHGRGSGSRPRPPPWSPTLSLSRGWPHLGDMGGTVPGRHNWVHESLGDVKG